MSVRDRAGVISLSRPLRMSGAISKLVSVSSSKQLKKYIRKARQVASLQKIRRIKDTTSKIGNVEHWMMTPCEQA